jgi:hypothetical protein
MDRGSCIPTGAKASAFCHRSIFWLLGSIQIHLQHKQFYVPSHNFSLLIAKCSLLDFNYSLLMDGISFMHESSSRRSSLIPFSCHPLISIQAVKGIGEQAPYYPLPLLAQSFFPCFHSLGFQQFISDPVLAVPFQSWLPSLFGN